MRLCLIILISIAVFILLSVILWKWKKKKAIMKVSSMTFSDKNHLLNSLISPLGYVYINWQDLISSRNDAWQRDYGYNALYDYAAPHFNMVFDWLPIYFDYANRTWLLELWKGQYGINTGAEVGLYYHDSIVPKENLKTTQFECVADADMLPMSFTLSKSCLRIAYMAKTTWWLTAFRIGRYSSPDDLSLEVSISFPNQDMLNSFLIGLRKSGFPREKAEIHHLRVTMLFTNLPKNRLSLFQYLSRWKAQLFNKLFCKLYLSFTKPFLLTLDRLLFLYYLLPFCFRLVFRLHYCKKNKCN